MRIDCPAPTLAETRMLLPRESLDELEYNFLVRIIDRLERGVYVNTRSWLHEEKRIQEMTDEKLRTRLERIGQINKMELFMMGLIVNRKYEVLKHALKHRVYRKDLR